MDLRTIRIVRARFQVLYVVLMSIILGACGGENDRANNQDIISRDLTYSVDDHYILKNGEPIYIKGIVYVPGYPGFLPWDIERSITLPENLQIRINTDIANIKALGANTIRFWGAPEQCYIAVQNVGGMNFIQTIWIDGSYPDLQDPGFKEQTKNYIKEVIDRIYTVYTDHNPPLIAYLVGNELSELSILTTDAAHPDITQFTGNYIVTHSNLTATEAFIAEMADYVKTYEYENYGNASLVSYANEIRTVDIIDTPFLDFRSQNAYSYAVPYYRPNTLPGSNTGTLFQGWVDELKAKYPDMPLLITETGLSVSPNADNAGAPDYGYGGNTEMEQATGLAQNIDDINQTLLPTAGVVIHEYLDAWWKFGLQDSYSQDPNDIEEWFGIASIISSDNWYSTQLRDSYYAISQAWQNQ